MGDSQPKMKTWLFEAEQWFPLSPDRVFRFYADAFNLEQITPPLLQFKEPGPHFKLRVSR